MDRDTITNKDETKQENKTKQLLAKAKGLSAKKKTQYLIMVIVIAMILLIYFSTFGSGNGSSNKDTGGETATMADSTAQMEEKLKGILAKVEGAGEVDVMIYYESTAEQVPAFSEDTTDTSSTNNGGESSTKSQKSDVAKVQGSSGSDALIIKEIAPEVRGVVVVAQGAGNISVRLNLLEAVTTLLDVPKEKVEVLKMNIRINE